MNPSFGMIHVDCRSRFFLNQLKSICQNIRHHQGDCSRWLKSRLSYSSFWGMWCLKAKCRFTKLSSGSWDLRENFLWCFEWSLRLEWCYINKDHLPFIIHLLRYKMDVWEEFWENLYYSYYLTIGYLCIYGNASDHSLWYNRLHCWMADRRDWLCSQLPNWRPSALADWLNNWAAKWPPVLPAIITQQPYIHTCTTCVVFNSFLVLLNLH